jgi:hypothetical protein
MPDHVPLDPVMALPPWYRYVQDYLWRYDPALRMRRSVDHAGQYVLERRVTRSRPIHTDRHDLSDRQIQARDGYVEVSVVHPWYLDRPTRMLAKLLGEGADLWREGGAARVAAQMEATEAQARADRRWTRRQMLRDRAKEGFDLLDRLGGIGGTERMRINNAGLPPPPAASGEIPESGDCHADSLGTSGGRQDRQLHGQPGG